MALNVIIDIMCFSCLLKRNLFSVSVYSDKLINSLHSAKDIPRRNMHLERLAKYKMKISLRSENVHKSVLILLLISGQWLVTEGKVYI